MHTKIENDIFEDDSANKDNFQEDRKDVFIETIVKNVLDYEIIHDYNKISSFAPSKNGIFIASSEYSRIFTIMDICVILYFAKNIQCGN